MPVFTFENISPPGLSVPESAPAAQKPRIVIVQFLDRFCQGARQSERSLIEKAGGNRTSRSRAGQVLIQRRGQLRRVLKDEGPDGASYLSRQYPEVCRKSRSLFRLCSLTTPFSTVLLGGRSSSP